MDAPRTRPRARRRSRRAVAALLGAVLLAGCGVRLEEPPPAVPTPGAAEVARQDAARAAAELGALAAAVPAADADVRAALAEAEEAATAHLEALGGVWEPWPGAGPDGTAPPAPDATPTPSPESSADPARVLEALAQAAHDAAGVARAGGDGADVLGSVAVSRTHDARALADALGVPPPGLPEGAPLPPDAALSDDARSAADAGRYAYEVVAARSGGTAREPALDRAASLGELARTPGGRVYDVTGPLGEPLAGLSPEATLAARAELDLLGAWLADLPAAEGDPAALLAAALDAADRVRALGAPLPALPGLTG